jgi:hypothetical protein
MNQREAAWLDHQRCRWLRPNAHLYWRPDAARFPPAHLHHLLPPQLRPSAQDGYDRSRPNIVQWTGRRGRWTPERDTLELAEERRAAAAERLDLKSRLLKLRSDLAFERFKRAYFLWARAEEIRRKANFNPAQPRWPAGSGRISGQWSGGVGTARSPIDPAAVAASPTHSDLDHDPRLGQRYVSRFGRSGSRPPLGQFSGTPRQEAEQQGLQIRFNQARNAIQRVDPNWQPGPRLESVETIEQSISSLRSLAQEAEAHLDVLFRLNITPETLRPNEISRPMVEEILAPGGVKIGYSSSGAGAEVRTVSSAEFTQVRDQLMAGAQPIRTPSDYRGLMFERSDGTSFGL